MIRHNAEYLVAGLRQQTQALGHVLEEIEAEKLQPEALAWRLRAIELGLRHLRETTPADPSGPFSRILDNRLYKAA